MCDPIRLSDSIEVKFVQGVRKYDKEETWRNKGTREEKMECCNREITSTKYMEIKWHKVIQCRI